MPFYDYQCDREHTHERYFSVEEKPFAVKCPKCRGESLQVILTAPAIATIGTFSRSIDDSDVRESIACDGSYLDPTLSYCPETGKVIAPITSEKQRRQLMAARGLEELPPSDKAKDVALAKKRKRKIYCGSGSRA
jgi:putative FmdB family regulatory protein